MCFLDLNFPGLLIVHRQETTNYMHVSYYFEWTFCSLKASYKYMNISVAHICGSNLICWHVLWGLLGHFNIIHHSNKYSRTVSELHNSIRELSQPSEIFISYCFYLFHTFMYVVWSSIRLTHYRDLHK